MLDVRRSGEGAVLHRGSAGALPHDVETTGFVTRHVDPLSCAH